MKNSRIFVWGAALILLVPFCAKAQNHFISDPNYRAKVEQQFEKQKALAKNRAVELFNVFDQRLNTEEQEALKFLYAYMPLSDLADYDGRLFLQDVRIALEARKTFAWGNKIPEQVFRHFVLPYRVNTENLDSSRVVFFNELKDRIKNMSLKEAVLEVNHWCHEKVTYKPTDRRTTGPLALIKAIYGRCGEETVFTISALRAVAIPARQCYVPRWAHTEGNHAWVEVWVDGKWYYFGACEPEPDLNMAWFTEPVKRVMMLNTIVFGNYDGPEEFTSKQEQYTAINNISMYAPVKEVFVKVTDVNGRVVENASVEFQIFNSNQFYTLTKKLTGKDGMCSQKVGCGDMMVWASVGDKFGYKKVSAAQTDKVEIVINKNPAESFSESMEIVPPVAKEVTVFSQTGREENNRRLLQEDALRNAYVATFIDSISSRKLALELTLSPVEVWDILKKSQGNWKEIVDFLRTVPPDLRKLSVELLNTVSEKDLHDTGKEIFRDHLFNSLKYRKEMLGISDDIFVRSVASPKIGSEILTAYKSYLQGQFDAGFIRKAQQDVTIITDWIRSNIKIDDESNYYDVPITPKGVFDLKVADSQSRNMFFVALCRCFGIPARMSFASRNPQYYTNGAWKDVNFEGAANEIRAKGFYKLNNITADLNSIPRPYSHVRVTRFANGTYSSPFFDRNQRDNTKAIETDAGNYLLIAGNRMQDGTVLAKLSFFNVLEGKTTVVDLDIPAKKTETTVYGTLDLRSEIELLKNHAKINLQNIAGKNGLIMAWIDPDKEPTNHAMSDVQTLKAEFEKLNVSFVFFVNKDIINSSFNSAKYDLPKNSHFALDNNEILKSSKISSLTNLPVIIIVDERGKVIYLSEGYKIGIGEQLIKACNSRQQSSQAREAE